MKRSMGLPMLLLLLCAATDKPPASPADVVARQLTAYNAHDAEGFAATYAPDALIFKPAATAPVLKGREAIRKSYAALFATKADLHVDVSARLIAGNFISDHESVRGTMLQAIAVYDVRDGLIQRAWLFAPPAP